MTKRNRFKKMSTSMSCIIIVLVALTSIAVEARIGICTFPLSWREITWYSSRSNGYNVLKTFSSYSITTTEKRIDASGDGTEIDKNDCIDDYTVDEHNLWFLQGEPDERQPNYCIPVFLRDTVMLIGGADRADNLDEARQCVNKNVNFRDVNVRYPFDFTRSTCPFTKQNSMSTFQVSYATSNYNRRYCEGDSTATMAIRDGRTMEFSFGDSCVGSGFRTSYEKPFRSSLTCVEHFEISGTDYVILAYQNSDSTDSYSFICAAYSEDAERGQVELSMLVESPDKARCNIEANARTVMSNGDYTQLIMKPNQCDQAGVCEHGSCTERLDGFTCDCDRGWEGVNCDRALSARAASATDTDYCDPDPCVHGTCESQVNQFTCACDEGYEGLKCDMEGCQFPSSWVEHNWWKKYDESYDDDKTEFVQFNAASGNQLAIMMGPQTLVYRCESYMAASRDSGFHVFSALDTATNNLRHCMEIKVQDNFMFTRMSASKISETAIKASQCESELGFNPTSYDIWVKYPAHTATFPSCSFPSGDFATSISTSSGSKQCVSSSDYTTKLTKMTTNVHVFSCKSSNTYYAPFGPDVALHCVGEFNTKEIDSVDTGKGVIVAYEDPSRTSMQSGGISFYCGRWIVEDDTIKLSLYAKDKWSTKCEINKNYETSSGDYVAFEWKAVQCLSFPCLNGGTCVNTIKDNTASYKCNCPAGYTGENCETNGNECESNPCVNGICRDGPGSYTCDCFNNYYGVRCELAACDLPSSLSDPNKWWTGWTNGYTPNLVEFNNTALHDLRAGIDMWCESTSTIDGDIYVAWRYVNNGYRSCSKITTKNQVLLYRETSSTPKSTPYTASDCFDLFKDDSIQTIAPEVWLENPVGGVFNNGECDFIETTYEMWFQQLASEVYTCRNVDSSRAVINSGGYSFAFDSCYTGSVSYQRPFTNTELHCIETIPEKRVDGMESGRGDVVILSYEDPANPGKFSFYCARYLVHDSTLSMSLNVANPARTECDFDATFNSADYENQHILLTTKACLQDNPCQNGGTCDDVMGGYLCLCSSGFTGTNCEIDINECASVPCANGGSCTDRVNHFTCVCPSGFSGPTCTDSSSCQMSPCMNGGTCREAGSSFTCACMPGWTDNRCQTEINECASNPCQNQGTCIDRVNYFECKCPPGVEGPLCNIAVSECRSQPCQHGSTCLDRIGGYYCRCPVDYLGIHCEQRNECSQDPCQNGGTCLDDLGVAICQCLPTFTGTFCERAVSPCDEYGEKCTNGGVCVVTGQNYYCQCPSGFTGTYCQIEQNSCDPNPCYNGGICNSISTNQFRCTCKEGYTGTQCTEMVRNPCASSPCQHGGTCGVIGWSGYTCYCPTGFTGDNCEIGDVTPCFPNPCQNNGICTVVGSNAYRCTCPTGYAGNTCKESSTESSTLQMNTLTIVLIIIGAVLVLAVLLACCCICIRGGFFAAVDDDDEDMEEEVIVVDESDAESNRSSLAWYPEYKKDNIIIRG